MIHYPNNAWLAVVLCRSLVTGGRVRKLTGGLQSVTVHPRLLDIVGVPNEQVTTVVLIINQVFSLELFEEKIART